MRVHQRKPVPQAKKARRSEWGRKRRRKRRDEPSAAEGVDESVADESAEAEAAEGTSAEATDSEMAPADMIRISELTPEARLRAIRALCELCCEESDAVWEHCNLNIEQVSE